MTNIEHREIKGITIKNLVVTVFSMISIVVSVMGTYFQLKSDINDIRARQDATARVSEIRLKIIEGQVAVLQQEVDQLKEREAKPIIRGL